MEFEDEIFLDDDGDFLDIIRFGFPRRYYQRTDFFNDLDDLSFFRRFRLQKDTVLMLLNQIENNLEFDNNLNNSLSPINQILTTLRFYASNSHQNCIGDFINMHQSTASRVIKKVTHEIASLSNHYIKMPVQAEIIRTQNDFFQLASFPRVIGCIDGTHIKIQSPGGDDSEIFRNRKSWFSINTQLVAGANLKIFDLVARWPGSAHDSTIFNSSRIRARFEEGEFPNMLLLGDSGYQLKPYLMTPLQNPVTRAKNLYNESQIRTRNVVERLIGVWKRRFPVLAYGMRCKLDSVMAIIVATAVLQNIAVDMNEDLPPPPEEINAEEFDYLLFQGDIPNEHHVANLPNVLNFRQNLINNYFTNL